MKDGEGRGAFSEPPFRKAAEFYTALFRDSLAPILSWSEIGNVYQEFGRGTFAMWITGPWNIGEFRRRLPPELQGSLGHRAHPGARQWPAGVSLAGGSSLVLFHSSRRKEDAWKLVEYLSEPAQQVLFYRLVGDLPARRSAWKDPILAADPAVAAFSTQLDRVVATPKVPQWEQVATKILEHLEPAIRGRVRVPEALAALDHDVDAVLEKRRWMLSRRRVAGPAGALPTPGSVAAASGRSRDDGAEILAQRGSPRGDPLPAPGLTIVGVFFLVPVAGAFLLAFTDFDIYALADLRNVRLVGFFELTRLSAKPGLLDGAPEHALLRPGRGTGHRARLSGGRRCCSTRKRRRWKGLFRTVISPPFVTTLVAVATVFRFLYHPRFGLLNQFLRTLRIAPVDWLGDPRWAMPAIVILAVWKNFGYNMIVFIAGLQSIPESLYEAARLDGAGRGGRSATSRFPCWRPRFSSSAS